MADNVVITAGTGTTVHADEYTHATLGAGKTQLVKLVTGTLDSGTPVGVADIGVKANAIRVCPSSDITDGTYIGDIKFGESLPAGTNAIGKLAANSGVDIGDVDVASIAAGDNNIGNVDIVTVPAPLNVVGGGVEAAALRVTLASDSTGVLSVDDNAGSLTTDTAGDIAHDEVDSGNPVKVGGKAINMDGTTPGTAVAEADRANFITDLYGRQCVETVHPCFGSATANYAAAQTDTQVVATPGAGLSLYITDIILSTDTAGSIKLVEDTAAAADKLELMYFAANGGAVIPLRTPIKLTANKNLGITSTISGNHSITVSYYIAP